MNTVTTHDAEESAMAEDHPATTPRTAPRAPRATRQASGAAGHGPDAAPQAPGAPRSIDQMRAEIDTIDAELLRLIQRRTALSHDIGEARASEGGTRIVYSREMKVLDRFAPLGPAGTDLAMLLLSLGRGKLGRR